MSKYKWEYRITRYGLGFHVEKRLYLDGWLFRTTGTWQNMPERAWFPTEEEAEKAIEDHKAWYRKDQEDQQRLEEFRAKHPPRIIR